MCQVIQVEVEFSLEDIIFYSVAADMQLVDFDVLSQLDDVELNSTDADYEIKLYEF